MVKASWFTLNQDRHPGVSVKATVLNERVTIVGLRIERPEGLALDDLRSIALPAIEASLNDGTIHEALTRQRIRLEGSAAPAPPRPPTKREMRFSIPKGRKYPDRFYVAVALVYRQLVANGIRPGPALAEANGVPVSTVHRWIKEARSRGLLAPARKGGATG